jgi:hypothetical protein
MNAPLPVVRFIHKLMWIIKEKKNQKKKSNNSSYIFNKVIKAKLKDVINLAVVHNFNKYFHSTVVPGRTL